jgi:hypothetical protein
MMEVTMAKTYRLKIKPSVEAAISQIKNWDEFNSHIQHLCVVDKVVVIRLRELYPMKFVTQLHDACREAFPNTTILILPPYVTLDMVELIEDEPFPPFEDEQGGYGIPQGGEMLEVVRELADAVETLTVLDPRTAVICDNDGQYLQYVKDHVNESCLKIEGRRSYIGKNVVKLVILAKQIENISATQILEINRRIQSRTGKPGGTA